MKSLASALAILSLGLVSCDKAKHAVDAARDKLEGVKEPGLPKLPGGEVSDEFASQVDSAAEGVRFRRDLPFPVDLQVRVIDRTTYQKARIITNSALGSETVVADGAIEVAGVIELRGGRVSLTIENFGRVPDPKEVAEKGKVPVAKPSSSGLPERPELVGARASFEWRGDAWRLPAQSGAIDFNVKMLEQDLLPNLPVVLQKNGLTPRLQWFASARRWLGGDKLVLEGDALELLFDKGATGKVTLTYEVSEAVDGHPCGRFAVEGDITLRNAGTLDGSVIDGEVTIQSGKVWCSLLHPLVLREEYQTVKTVTSGKGGGPKKKIQGAIQELRIREWKP